MNVEIDQKTGERRLSNGAPVETALDPATLSTLHAMDKDALVSLVMRMSRQCGMVAAMTEEETAQAMLDTLAHTALKPIVLGVNMKADIDSRLKAVDRWLDRTQGKAIQRIDQRVMNVHKGVAGDMSNDELLAAIRGIKQLPSGITLLEDGTLDVVSEENISGQ